MIEDKATIMEVWIHKLILKLKKKKKNQKRKGKKSKKRTTRARFFKVILIYFKIYLLNKLIFVNNEEGEV